jgi:hypothetical protein
MQAALAGLSDADLSASEPDAWKVDLAKLDNNYHMSLGETESCMVYESRFPDITDVRLSHYE